MSGDYSRFTHKPRKRFSGVLMQQGRVQLDADWNEGVDISKRRWEIQATDTFGRAAVPRKTTPNGFKITRANTGKITGVGVGRLYVDGLLAERLDGDPLFSNLPFHPDPPPLEVNKPAIVYLDVREREVTYIEDPELLEPALGGPDTATRTQVVWQVKTHLMASPQCGLDLDAIFPPSAGRLTSRAVAPPASDDPCVLPPTGNYRGLENRLYRVEVHVGGTLGTATFKWSRENASIVSQVTGISGKTITVNRIGRDKVLRFQAGNWVEVTDDLLELQGLPGHMAKVVKPEEATLALELDRDLSAHFPVATLALRHTRVRHWDQKKDENGADLANLGPGTLKTGSGPVRLGDDGVEIEITAVAGGKLKTGDYWVFAARTIDGSVEALNQVPPRGIHHHYAQLAAWDGTDLHDCRHLWPDGCCCCTVEVGDGVTSHGDFNDIETAYKEAKWRARTDGVAIRICILPGLHRPPRTVVIDRPDVTISGCGRVSRINAPISGPIFSFVRGADRARLEHLHLFSDKPDSLVYVFAAAETWIEGNLFTGGDAALLVFNRAFGSTVFQNLFFGRTGIECEGVKLTILQNELVGTGSHSSEKQGLIDIRASGDEHWAARVIGNHLRNGLGHGITLTADKVTNPFGKTVSLKLQGVLIADNLIRDMRGTGIAMPQLPDAPQPVVSPSIDEHPPKAGVFVHDLRIEGNEIVRCAGSSTWMRPDGAPQGGCVVGGVRYLEISDNQIVENGQAPPNIPVAGIYIGGAEGLIVRDNVVTENGRATGAPALRVEGGVVAVHLDLSTEPVGSFQISADPGFGVERQAEIGTIDEIQEQRDGWPAAMVHGNLIVAQHGRALVLRGFGPMQVTDNRLVSRELRTGQDPIERCGTLFIQGGTWVEGFWYTWINVFIRDIYLPPALLPWDGSVVVSDNQVLLERVIDGSEGYVTDIHSFGDLAFQDNVVHLGEGRWRLHRNTRLGAVTVRAIGNAVTEAERDAWAVFVSLSVQGAGIPNRSTVIGNQVTHCIEAPNPVFLGNIQSSACTPSTPAPHTSFAGAIESQQVAASLIGKLRAQVEVLRTEAPSEEEASPGLLARIGAAERMIDHLETGVRLSTRTSEIQPSDWTLAGRVLDPEGKPVAGARLEIAEAGKKLSEIQADDKGDFFANYSGERFKDIFTRAPQLTLTVKSSKGKVLQTLDRPLVPKSDHMEALVLQAAVPPTGPAPGGAPAPASEETPEPPPEKPPARKEHSKSMKPKKPRPGRRKKGGE